MNRKILSFASMFTLLSYGLMGRTCFGLSHTGFNVFIDPMDNSARIGRTFSINITISNVSAPGLWAYEFKLYYNSSLLEPLSAKIPADHFLQPTLSPDGLFIINHGTINQTEGTVSFSATLVGAEPGKTGNGTIASITFVAVASGKSTLRIGGYITGEPKFIDGNGNTVPSTDYSLIDGYAEGIPPPPPPILPPSPAEGEQTLAFNFVGIYGYLTFPEECHLKDVIAYDLLVAAEPEGVHLNYFKLNISCNTPNGTKILHNETYEDKDLPETWILNETITIMIPNDAYGKTYCLIETETYTKSTTCDSSTGLDATYIETMTYKELQTTYEELLDQYSLSIQELGDLITEYEKLNNTCLQLLDLYSTIVNELQHWQSEYYALNDTHHGLLNQYNATIEQLNYWIDKYEKLNNTHTQLLKDYGSLNSSYQKLWLDYNSLKTSYDSLEVAYRSLNVSYNLLQSNYQQLQSKYTEPLERYNSPNWTYQELNLNYARLTLSFEELEHNMTLLQARYDNLSTSYNLLNSTYYALLEERETLRLRSNALVRELWLTRALWSTFLGISIAAAVYITYLLKRKVK